jgi:hypothetical protein
VSASSLPGNAALNQGLYASRVPKDHSNMAFGAELPPSPFQYQC